jgi:superfamily II DNA helicase RecQ
VNTAVATASVTPLAVLQEVFGYTAFRDAQADIVEHVAPAAMRSC